MQEIIINHGNEMLQVHHVPKTGMQVFQYRFDASGEIKSLTRKGEVADVGVSTITYWRWRKSRSDLANVVSIRRDAKGLIFATLKYRLVEQE